jgi:hypothetical protein
VAVSGLEQVVADYLRTHPDFLSRHSELLAELELFHSCGKAASLIEYQVLVLRDQHRQLRRRLQELVATARDNEQLSDRVHRLTLSLVRCRGLREVLDTLYGALGESFGAERAVVRLYAAPAGGGSEALTELLGEDEAARRALAPVLGATSPICGRIPGDQLSALFGEAGSQVASAALLPLGPERRFGVLAIGSGDERRYQPGMATTFLRQLADVAGEVMAPFLALE